MIEPRNGVAVVMTEVIKGIVCICISVSVSVSNAVYASGSASVRAAGPIRRRRRIIRITNSIRIGVIRGGQVSIGIVCVAAVPAHGESACKG